MSYELNNNDYKKILKYYQLPIPKSSRLLRKNAEDIISQKLCSCIKKVDATNEQKSIGICTKTVINRKGMKRGKFNCKGKNYITIKKSKKNLSINLKKTIKNKNKK